MSCHLQQHISKSSCLGAITKVLAEKKYADFFQVSIMWESRVRYIQMVWTYTTNGIFITIKRNTWLFSVKDYCIIINNFVLIPVFLFG